MDVNFSNCQSAAPLEPQIDWMALAAQMEKLSELSVTMPTPPPSLSGNSSSSAYNSPPTTTSQPFSTIPLSLPPAPITVSNSNHAAAATDPPFAAGEYCFPADGRAPLEAMREMIFRIAAMQPVHIDPESVKPPKRRRNVRISKDPQSVAARHRRERISERIRILQRLVPGGTKMDMASMLDEAIHYVKFLKTQVQSLERAANGGRSVGFAFPPAAAAAAFATGNYGWVALDEGYDQVVAPQYGFDGNVNRY